jgi:glycosyltransferase involved in cell wall biosynthesis
MYNLGQLRRPVAGPPRVLERVSVLLPVRDEASSVGPCLQALLAQENMAELEIWVLDDGSSDGTVEIARDVAGQDARVRLVDGGHEPPPPGWLGKSWACHRLAALATGTVLVFVDADVLLATNAVAASVHLLRTSGLDLVCPYPRQLAGTPAERLVQPLLQWSWLTTLPLGVAERSSRPSLAAANGQLLLVDTASYRRCGGHQRVAGAVLDDLELLRSLKRAGGHGTVVDGTGLATCRMYRGWADLQAGYSKSLWAAFGSPAGAAAVTAVLAVTYVLPFLAALRGSRTGLVGYAAAVAGRALVAHRVEGRVWPDSLAHPASIAALAVLSGRSLLGHRAGTLTWKGRTLP